MILTGTLAHGVKTMKHIIPENLKGITGKFYAKRYKQGTVDKVQPLFSKANTLKKREAWVWFAIDNLGFNWLVPFAKRLQRKWVQIESKAEVILNENFLGIGAVTDNLVVSSSNHGRNLICQRLAGLTTYDLAVGYVEMGTSATAPTNADTDLNAAVVRAGSPAYSISNNVLTLRFFLADGTVANNTYNEMGTFIGGSATLGSGQMWNHALFSSPYVKASGEDTTIELVITVN